MTDFYQIFKEKAHNKDLTSSDMLMRCVYKTIKAKSENKKEILDFFIKKAFTPRKCSSYKWAGLKEAWNNLRWRTQEKYYKDPETQKMSKQRLIFGEKIENFFNEEETILFDELIAHVNTFIVENNS